MIKVGKVNPDLITNEFLEFDYVKQPIKESEVTTWREQGYTHPEFTGALYGGENLMPSWTKKIARDIGLHDCGFTFYKMNTLEIMPPHVDHFDTYCRIFEKPRDRVYRAIVFLEDWKPGHYFEYNNQPFTGWKKGDYVLYSANIFHAASNIGIEPRYTLQITGTYEILLSLEKIDPLTGYYQANGSSPSWYAKEENRFSLPKMWGWWDLFGSAKEEFTNRALVDKTVIKELVTPLHNDTRVKYVTADELNGKKHIYLISITTPYYFEDNKEIGFKCISDQYKESIRKGDAKLVLYQPYEGDSGKEGNQDLEILEEWIRQERFSGENVFYIHGNLIINKAVENRGYSFNAIPYIYFDHTVNIPDEFTLPEYTIEDSNFLFLCYGRVPRRHRIEFANLLLKENLLSKGKVSLNKFNDHGDSEFEELRKLTPLTLDTTLEYNLLDNINTKHYRTTFLSIVNETLVEPGTIFLSEKTFKTIAIGHPFMILGNKGSVGYLKSIGFKTFDKWINESYDDESDYHSRMELMINELIRLNKLPPADLVQIRKEMQEVLDYNKNHLKEQIYNRYETTNKHSPLVQLLQQIN